MLAHLGLPPDIQTPASLKSRNLPKLVARNNWQLVNRTSIASQKGRTKCSGEGQEPTRSPALIVPAMKGFSSGGENSSESQIVRVKELVLHNRRERFRMQ